MLRSGIRGELLELRFCLDLNGVYVASRRVGYTVLPWDALKTYTRAEAAVLVSGTAVVKGFVLISKVGNATSSAV